MLEGAELENQGGTATALSHWEKRLFEVNWFIKNTMQVKTKFVLIETKCIVHANATFILV